MARMAASASLSAFVTGLASALPSMVIFWRKYFAITGREAKQKLARDPASFVNSYEDGAALMPVTSPSYCASDAISASVGKAAGAPERLRR